MRLLLVEDEARLADIVRRGLAADGWNVTVAGSGEIALDLQDKLRFDIILLDLLLPGIDGLGVMRALNERGDTTPVLVLSALDVDDERIAAARALGACSLRKPIDFIELSARLKAALAGMGSTRGGCAGDGADIEPTGRRTSVTREQPSGVLWPA